MPIDSSRTRRFCKALALQLCLLAVTAVALELVLRALDFKYVRRSLHVEHSSVYRYDPELGWSAIPNSNAVVWESGSVSVHHNSLGLRDVEYLRTAKPTILFIGDSLVWGYNVEADQRFTEKLRPALPHHTIVNAGISGYGTDQEYLLLSRLWNEIEPHVVVLMFCVDNDRLDNTTNRRADYYKPYFVQSSSGGIVLQGQPVPKSRQWYFNESVIVQHSLLARALVAGYIALSHPRISVPDSITLNLIAQINSLVQTRGARLLVGLQRRDAEVESYLNSESIPFVSFDEAEHLGIHWTPAGHALVAARLLSLFRQAGLIDDVQ